jgi:hypothetical protein
MVELAEGESLIMTGPATNWHSKRTGTLTLTSYRIAFEPTQTLGLEINPRRIGVRERPGLEIALDQLLSTRLVPPLFGKVVCLEVVSRRQKAVFEVDNVHEWIQAIRTAQGGPLAAGDSPAPPTLQLEAGPAPVVPAIPPCPRCGGTPVREANGMLRCPNCSPGG